MRESHSGSFGGALANPAFRPTIEAALIGMPEAILLVEFAGDHKQAPSCPLRLSIQHAQAFLPPTAPALLLPQAPAAALVSAPSIDTADWINFAARARAPPSAA